MKSSHLDKTNKAKDAGYHCIHIWDWDNWNMVKIKLQKKQALYARKLTLREITKRSK